MHAHEIAHATSGSVCLPRVYALGAGTGGVGPKIQCNKARRLSRMLYRSSPTQRIQLRQTGCVARPRDAPVKGSVSWYLPARPAAARLPSVKFRKNDSALSARRCGLWKYSSRRSIHFDGPLRTLAAPLLLWYLSFGAIAFRTPASLHRCVFRCTTGSKLEHLVSNILTFGFMSYVVAF